MTGQGPSVLGHRRGSSCPTGVTHPLRCTVGSCIRLQEHWGWPLPYVRLCCCCPTARMLQRPCRWTSLPDSWCAIMWVHVGMGSRKEWQPIQCHCAGQGAGAGTLGPLPLCADGHLL